MALDTGDLPGLLRLQQTYGMNNARDGYTDSVARFVANPPAPEIPSPPASDAPATDGPNLSIPQAFYATDKYGEGRMLMFTTAPGVDTIVLPRSSGKRTFLRIQVQSGATLSYNWDSDSTQSGCQLIPGASAAYDVTTPQNDLHISSTGICTGIVEYVVTNPAISVV